MACLGSIGNEQKHAYPVLDKPTQCGLLAKFLLYSTRTRMRRSHSKACVKTPLRTPELMTSEIFLQTDPKRIAWALIT